MKPTCEKVQVAIATEASLEAAVREHLVLCEPCGRLYEAYQRLSALMQESGPPIPLEFADKVMARIASDAVYERMPSFSDQIAMRVFSSRPMQMGAFGVGGALSILGLIRFAFSVLIPT